MLRGRTVLPRLAGRAQRHASTHKIRRQKIAAAAWVAQTRLMKIAPSAETIAEQLSADPPIVFPSAEAETRSAPANSDRSPGRPSLLARQCRGAEWPFENDRAAMMRVLHGCSADHGNRADGNWQAAPRHRGKHGLMFGSHLAIRFPIDAVGASFRQHVIGRSNVVFASPGEPLYQRSATTMPPTLFRRGATARMIHARIRLIGVFRNGQRKLDAQRQRQINRQRCPLRTRFRAAKEHSPKTASGKSKLQS